MGTQENSGISRRKNTTNIKRIIKHAALFKNLCVKSTVKCAANFKFYQNNHTMAIKTYQQH